MCDRSINQGGPGVPSARLGRPLPRGFHSPLAGGASGTRSLHPARHQPPRLPPPWGPLGEPGPGRLLEASPRPGGKGRMPGIPGEPAGPPTMAGPSSGEGLRRCPPHPVSMETPPQASAEGSGVAGSSPGRAVTHLPSPGRGRGWRRREERREWRRQRRAARRPWPAAPTAPARARPHRPAPSAPPQGPRARAALLVPAAERRGRAGAVLGSPRGRGPGGGERL